MKQYPPVSFAALLAMVIVLPSCADQAHHRIAFASSTAEDPAAESGGPGAPSSLVAVTPKADGRIVLVTIDGVRAEDVFDGADKTLRPGSNVDAFTSPDALMPRTRQLVKTRGVALGADRFGCGSVRTASGANVSLPGYLEIFTGRKTHCRDNNCDRTKLHTVLDEAAAVGITPVASIGSWEILDRAVSNGAPGVFVADGTLRWPGSRPIANDVLEQLVATGERADAYPGHGRYRPDANTSAIALEYLRTALPAVLHVGFGDPDEYGHRNDYPSYLSSIRDADAFIGKVADTLDAMGDIGSRTTVIVTTDHGRNRDFQHHGAFSLTSARTFVMAFGPRVAVRGVACPSRDVTLADIAPTMRVLMGLPPDASPDAGRPIEEIAASPEPAAIAYIRVSRH